MTELLTRRQYSEYRKENGLVGSTYQTVCQNVRQGKITIIDGKWIDPAVADLEWTRNTRTESYPIADQPHPTCDLNDEDLPDRATSQMRIEATKAILISLDLEEKQGTLVKVADVYEELFDVISTLKQSLMLIPQRVSPEIASLSDITDIENALDKEINASLEQLSEQLSRSNVIKDA